MKKCEHNIHWHGEEDKVKGYCEQYLMVHKIPTEERKHLWTISHIQTGFGIGLKYPPFDTMKEAKEIVYHLTMNDDWYLDGSLFGDTSMVSSKRMKQLHFLMLDVWKEITGISVH